MPPKKGPANRYHHSRALCYPQPVTLASWLPAGFGNDAHSYLERGRTKRHRQVWKFRQCWDWMLSFSNRIQRDIWDSIEYPGENASYKKLAESILLRTCTSYSPRSPISETAPWLLKYSHHWYQPEDMQPTDMLVVNLEIPLSGIVAKKVLRLCYQ